MIFRLLAGLTACLLLSACASQPQPQPQQWDQRVVRGELANGLRYNLVALPDSAGRLDLRLTVHAGSVDETAEQVGVAHLLEHLVFYSRTESGQDVRSRLQSAGFVQGRHFNAVTSYDRTQYLLSPPRGNPQLELSLQALATLVFAGNFQAQDLERERPVVIEEWRGGLGTAERMNGQRIASQRVGSKYPAHRTIGNRQAIEQARLAQLQAFQQRWYAPGNMTLNIVGDFDPQQLAQQIHQAFGQAKARNVPPREHLELTLDKRLKAFELHDTESGANRVVMLWRLHESMSRRNDTVGVRERLIDRMTLALTNTQLRRQKLPTGITQLTLVRTQIGRRSAVVGLSAGVQGDAHAAGLTSLLQEMQRLREHGFYADDVAAERTRLQRLAESMLAKTPSADFADWVRRLNDATLADRPLQHPHDIARLTLQALAEIEAEDLRQRLRTWSDSPDRVLQYSAPGQRRVRPASAEEVARLQRHIGQQALSAPQAPAAVLPEQPPQDPPSAVPGTLTTQQDYPREQVQYWQLSNGDRLVWLRLPTADGRAHLLAESTAGFADADIPTWQLQFASQLAEQSPPAFWSASQYQQWQKQHAVGLRVDQKAQRLQLSGSASLDQLSQLLTLYRIRQLPPSLDIAAFEHARDELAESLSRRLDTQRGEQQRLWQRLKQGGEEALLPEPEAVAALTYERLQQLWQRQQRAPVTYYLLADSEPQALADLVSRELAGIVRGQAPRLRAHWPEPGQRSGQLANAVEPRASLYATSFATHPWNPQDAVRVAYLREVARDALKARLRSQASGVYRLDFEAELSPEQQRIVSELRFTSAPERLDELWHLAQSTLSELPHTLSESDLDPLRQRLRESEQERLNDPLVQFQRLQLSDQAWGDPRYLNTQKQLPEALQLAPMRALAAQLLATPNRVVLKVTPAQQDTP